MSQTIRVSSQFGGVDLESCKFKFDFFIREKIKDIFKFDFPVPDEITSNYNLHDYIYDVNCYDDFKYTIFATEKLSDIELYHLQKFCVCAKCSLAWYDIRRCLAYGCSDCLYSYNPPVFSSSQRIIDGSRRAYLEYVNKKES